jgi:hypothetical protein
MTDGQLVCLGVKPLLGPMTRFNSLAFDIYSLYCHTFFLMRCQAYNLSDVFSLCHIFIVFAIFHM